MRTASYGKLLAIGAFALTVAVAPSCMSTAPVATPVATPPPPASFAPATWEQKLAWIVRLEDQRILREPAPTAASPSDLLVLIRDQQARVRRRAALAIGRVGLSEGLPFLAERLKDEDTRGAADGGFRDGPHRRSGGARGAARGARQPRSAAARPGGRGAGPHRRQGRRPRRGRHGAEARGRGRAAPPHGRQPRLSAVARDRGDAAGALRAGAAWELRRPGGRGGGRTRSPCFGLVAGGLRAAAGGRPPGGAAADVTDDTGPLHCLLRYPWAGGGKGHFGHTATAHAGAGAQGRSRRGDPGDPGAGHDGRRGRRAAAVPHDDWTPPWTKRSAARASWRLPP